MSSQKVNESIRNASKLAGICDENSYGRVRTHCLRKFFVTQLTNHGVQDKVVNHFIGHSIPEVDRAYWNLRLEELRRIYAEKEQFLSPTFTRDWISISNLHEVKQKIVELEWKINFLWIESGQIQTQSNLAT